MIFDNSNNEVFFIVNRRSGSSKIRDIHRNFSINSIAVVGSLLVVFALVVFIANDGLKKSGLSSESNYDDSSYATGTDEIFGGGIRDCSFYDINKDGKVNQKDSDMIESCRQEVDLKTLNGNGDIPIDDMAYASGYASGSDGNCAIYSYVACSYTADINNNCLVDDADSNILTSSLCYNDLEASIATLKDTYMPGEKLELTDPPDNLIAAEMYLQVGAVDNTKSIAGSTSSTPILEYKGYIIEFNEAPLLAKKAELDKQARLSQKGLISVSSELENYKNILNTKHGETKKNVLAKLVVNQKAGSAQNKLISEWTEVFNGIALDISDSEAREIEKISGVKKAWPNYKVEATLMDSVPQIGADRVWQIDKNGNTCNDNDDNTENDCITGKGVTIGIIDSGIDYTHEDLGSCTSEQFLSGSCEKVIGGYDFTTCYTFDRDSLACVQFKEKDNDPFEDNGHGTHVASTAAGNGILKGVAPDAKIVAYKVLNHQGIGWSSGIIEAIERSADPDQDSDYSDHLDIISLSLGGQGNPDDPASRAIDNIVNNGVVAVVSAGNRGSQEMTIGSPGTAIKAITVGAANKRNVLADFSSRGPVIWQDKDGNEQILIKPDIVAPGVNICAAEYDSFMRVYKCLDDKHIVISGTSMATPHVSGAVALIKQAHPDWTPGEIKSSIKSTAVDLGLSQTEQGAGMIDVEKVVKLNQPLDDYWDLDILDEVDTNVGLFIRNVHDTVVIKGIFPEGYDSLSVEYRKKGEENWKTGGLIIVGSGGIIAEFDPEGNILETGDYEFKARIMKDEIERSSITNLHFNKELRSTQLIKTNAVMLSSPVYFDIGGEFGLIVTTFSPSYGKYEGVIHLLDRDGIEKNGWPKTISSPISSSSAVGDVNNDGFLELVVASWDHVYVYDLFGNVMDGFPLKLNRPSSPVLWDINRDGFLEILVRDFDGKLYGFDYNGQILQGWPKNLGSGLSDPALGDLNNDGFPDILAKTYNKIYAFDYKGEMLDGWPISLMADYQSQSPPILGDVDNDGNLEVGVGINYKLYLFANNGKIKSGFPIEIPYDRRIAFSDLDGDNDLEIVMYGLEAMDPLNPDTNGIIYVFNHDGSLFQNFPIKIPTILDMASDFVIGDISGNSNKEILIRVLDKLVIISSLGETTVYLIDEQKRSWDIKSTPIIFDMDKDGFVDILFSSHYSDIYVWNLNTPYNPETMDWPMFHHDFQHSGCFGCKKPIPIPIRPQSKIVNIGNKEVTGSLIFKIEKNIDGKWWEYGEPYNKLNTIPARGLIKLDKIFNEQVGASLGETGNYRIRVIFEPTVPVGPIVESYWEFSVS